MLVANGFYAIFEGVDGAGKSTMIEAVKSKLSDILVRNDCDPSIIKVCISPGSTPLGKHIRQLVKYPSTISSDIVIDDLSRQMLYMVDTINCVKTILEPSLSDGKIILADRSSFISAMAYGMADGLQYHDIEKLFDIITPPKADKLFVLQIQPETSFERLSKIKDSKDHYDEKPVDFFRKVCDIYNKLITGPPERTVLVSRSVNIDNVVYIDATLDVESISNDIAESIYQAILSKNSEAL